MNTGSVKAYDGVKICYETKGRGDITLVFVHGWSCDRSYWRAQLDYFAKSHYVVAIDLGGHGESGLGRKDWTMAAFGCDVEAVIEALKLRKVILVGHSMSGPVIVEALQLIPDTVIALVVVDFFNDVEDTWNEKRLEAYLAPFRADFKNATESFVRRLFPVHSDEKLVKWIAEDMAAERPEVGISAMKSIRLYDQANALETVKVPMRLLNSDFWSTNIKAARHYKPDIELAIMPGVGHFLMMEAPEEFNRLLKCAVDDYSSKSNQKSL